MYEDCVTINLSDNTGHYTVLGQGDCRLLSGDLVGRITGSVFEVDQTDGWLFEWEKANPKCYARRKQELRFIKLAGCSRDNRNLNASNAILRSSKS